MESPIKRVLIKISGESFGQKEPFELEDIHFIIDQILELSKKGIEIALVVGGGNLIRGASLTKKNIDRLTADSMGMLATVINGLALRDILQQKGVKAKLLTSRKIESVAEPYNHEICNQYLREGYILIFSGGTGNPFFTTDTTAALRCAEISAQIFFKGTKVDGVYDKDPVQDPTAKKFDFLTYDEMLNFNCRVMDSTAVAFCKENNIPILVFDLMKPGNLLLAISKKIGTLIDNKRL